MSSAKRIWLLILLAVLAISTGALREFIFVNLNYWIDHVSRSTEFLYAHSYFDFMHGYSLSELNVLKWSMALIFVVIMFFLTIGILVTWFRTRTVIKWVVISYGLGILICGLFYGMYLLSPKFGFLVLAVKALHALQYPLIPLILIPAISLFERSGSR